MRERANRIDATLDISSTSDDEEEVRGTTVKVKVAPRTALTPGGV